MFQKVAARQSTAIEAYRDLQAKALFTRLAEVVLHTARQAFTLSSS